MIGLPLAARDQHRSSSSPPSLLDSLLGALAGDDLEPEPTSRVTRSETAVVALLCDLARAVADLASGHRSRVTTRACLGPQPWEIGLQRAGDQLLLSAFQGGSVPEVLIHQRTISLEAASSRLERALGRYRGTGANGASVQAALDELTQTPVRSLPSPQPAWASVEPPGAVPFVISSEIQLLGARESASRSPSVLRSDLLSLLFTGRIRISVGGHLREIPDVHVFLVAEQLAQMAFEGLEAAVQGRPYVRKIEVGGAVCGVRMAVGRGRAGQAGATITLGRAPSASARRAEPLTFPAVNVESFAQGIVAFGRALARTLVRRDRGQTHNLRLVAFRARLRETADLLRDAVRSDSVVNASPESYRAFAAATRRENNPSTGLGHGRLRFSARWFAAVPDIDLRSTFLCGEVLMVGSTREVGCIDRSTGDLIWRRAVPRAVSVMTPAGLARFDGDGVLHLHDIATGDVLWSLKLSPRVPSATAGAVVSCPGLPRMLIITVGRRHLAAVDLDAGELRWRYAARRGGTFRIRRAGRLVVVAHGEQALTALDVMSGEIVWRVCDRLRFASSVAVDHDGLFAIAGDGTFIGRGGSRLHHIDPWSGEVRWSRDLPRLGAPVGAPLLTSDASVVVTHGRQGTGLCAFSRRDGEPRFQRIASAGASSCLALDDTVLVNSDAAELCAFDASDGSLRFRHVFGDGSEDRPRRLEPVLRSGALFVPQGRVHVVRPRDGALLGSVPTDLVPDLLRVDEKCNVYVVEESGHLAAFGAAPRLTLVS